MGLYAVRMHHEFCVDAETEAEALEIVSRGMLWPFLMVAAVLCSNRPLRSFAMRAIFVTTLWMKCL